MKWTPSLAHPNQRLGAVLVVHALVLVAMTIVSARADTIADQVLVLNIAGLSQILASVACAAWLLRSRRAVLVRVRAQIARRSSVV